MANAIVCKWNGEWHVNKYQINKRDARQRCCVRVVFLWYASEVSANAYPCDGRAERENRITMNLIPVVRFVSLTCWDVWVVYVVALCRCHCFAAYYLSFASIIGWWMMHLSLPTSQPASQRRTMATATFARCYFINHVPNSVRSFIDITITNSSSSSSSEQRTCTKHSRNENSLSNSFV